MLSLRESTADGWDFGSDDAGWFERIIVGRSHVGPAHRCQSIHRGRILDRRRDVTMGVDDVDPAP
jgi:hypothetical protein